MIKSCQSKKDNHIAFGKSIGYLEGMNLKKQDLSKKVICVNYTLHGKDFFSFYKSKTNTDMKKELILLQNMWKVNDEIDLKIDVCLP